MTQPRQVVVEASSAGQIVAVDSAYDIDERNRDDDVVVMGSYSGVLPARFVAEHAPRGLIGVDCAIGKDGAGIAGLWFLEALRVPAAAADVAGVELGNGIDVVAHGQVSRMNEPAAAVGVVTGMPVLGAARLMLDRRRRTPAASEITNRTVVDTHPSGRMVVCMDSIAFGLPDDRNRNVLCTAGHTGRSAVPYLARVRPLGFVCSDGGRGRNDAGVAGLALAAELGLAGACVDARSARMGDGLSTYRDGLISVCNPIATERGVRVGQPAQEAAKRLVAASPVQP